MFIDWAVIKPHSCWLRAWVRWLVRPQCPPPSPKCWHLLPHPYLHLFLLCSGPLSPSSESTQPGTYEHQLRGHVDLSLSEQELLCLLCYEWCLMRHNLPQASEGHQLHSTYLRGWGRFGSFTMNKPVTVFPGYLFPCYYEGPECNLGIWTQPDPKKGRCPHTHLIPFCFCGFLNEPSPCSMRVQVLSETQFRWQPESLKTHLIGLDSHDLFTVAVCAWNCNHF